MRFVLPILLSSLLVASCSQSMNPDVVRGSTYQFRSGHPEVRMSAIGFLTEDNEPQINVTADVVYGSLIYKEVDGVQTAVITVEIQILDQNNTDNIIETQQYNLSLQRDDPNITYSQDVFTFEKAIAVSPGDYEINLTVIDQSSGRNTTRSSNTSIPDPQTNVTNLTNIRMLEKNVGQHNDAWLPVSTYDVQGKVDSLKFIFQVTNNESESPLTIDSRLIRYKSDTSVARPMHYNNYTPSTLPYKGIEYDKTEIIQSSRRVLTQPGSVLVEFAFAQQKRGNYRFEVTASEEDKSLFKARDFSVKSDNYPSIKTAREMAAPLAYLMNDNEYEDLMSIDNSDSLKNAVDRFWLKSVQNKNRAKNVIEMYYNRVEEANKQFSNFKEGWKTDLGMIYILFGPPWYVDEHLRTLTLSYTYDRSQHEYNYTFQKPKLKSQYYPFDNYLLQRSQRYFNVQYQQVQLWLTGQILSTPI